jgi:TolA-binding protein
VEVVGVSTPILMLLSAAVTNAPAGPSAGQLLIGSIAVALISGVTAVAVAFVNNGREREGSAESSLVLTLRERITLKVEKIEELEQDIEDLEKESAQKDELIAELRARNRELESASGSGQHGA